MEFKLVPGISSPPLVLSSASLSRSIFYSAKGLSSPLSFWELTFLLSPLVNWWESSLQLPGVQSCVSLCSLCSSLFLFLHPTPLLPTLLPFPWFLLSLVVVVSVSVQLRWQAARLSLHYQRVASQSLSHLKWKAEQRLRVTNRPGSQRQARTECGAQRAELGLGC